MEELLKDTEYRRRMYPILTWDADEVVGISGNFPQGDIPELYSYAGIQVVPGEATVWGGAEHIRARDRVDSGPACSSRSGGG